MRVPMFVAALLLLVGSGCAHHKADQYVYAPPYAPPVYPQPADPNRAVVAPAPVVAGAAAPPPAIVGGPSTPGGPCDPVMGAGVVQGSPCPPGEYVVPGSMVGGEIPCPPDS
jgi:hypothetical protein